MERATGRRVIGFASHVQVEEPRFMAEIFRLAAALRSLVPVFVRGELEVLAITEDAATAIDSIMASSGLPEGAGLRITQEKSTQSGGEARTDLRLSAGRVR